MDTEAWWWRNEIYLAFGHMTALAVEFSVCPQRTQTPLTEWRPNIDFETSLPLDLEKSGPYYLMSTPLSQLWLCWMNIKDASESVVPPTYLQPHCFLETPLRHIQTAPCTLQLRDCSQARYIFRATSLPSRICSTSDVHNARAYIAGSHRAVGGWRQ